MRNLVPSLRWKELVEVELELGFVLIEVQVGVFNTILEADGET